MPAITLKEAPHRKAICEAEMRYDILLDGVKVDEAYYNLRGYRAGIPTPGGGHLDPGEISLTQLKKEIAALNREFALARKHNPVLRPLAPRKKPRTAANPHLSPWNWR